jgi:hypothetical protein
VPELLVRSFTPLLLAFQPCFTQPSFSSFWAVTCAWILCYGRRSLTRVIQSGQLGRYTRCWKMMTRLCVDQEPYLTGG